MAKPPQSSDGVGRVRLQALSEINHPCWPLLAFLLSPHLSLCFPELVCLSTPAPPSAAPPPTVSVSLLNTAPFITETRFPSLSAPRRLPSVGVSHTLCQNDLDFSSGCVISLMTVGLIKHQNIIVSSLSETPQLKPTLLQT